MLWEGGSYVSVMKTDKNGGWAKWVGWGIYLLEWQHLNANQAARVWSLVLHSISLDVWDRHIFYFQRPFIMKTAVCQRLGLCVLSQTFKEFQKTLHMKISKQKMENVCCHTSLPRVEKSVRYVLWIWRRKNATLYCFLLSFTPSVEKWGKHFAENDEDFDLQFSLIFTVSQSILQDSATLTMIYKSYKGGRYIPTYSHASIQERQWPLFVGRCITLLRDIGLFIITPECQSVSRPINIKELMRWLSVIRSGNIFIVQMGVRAHPSQECTNLCLTHDWD